MLTVFGRLLCNLAPTYYVHASLETGWYVQQQAVHWIKTMHPSSRHCMPGCQAATRTVNTQMATEVVHWAIASIDALA